MKVSVVILAKNEEKNIQSCIESAKNLTDDIVVVDDSSTDKTAHIAQAGGAKVVSHPLNNNFAEQRNFALEQTAYPWVLYVDADEKVTPALVKEIQSLNEDTLKTVSAFYIPRHEFWQGRELTHGEVMEASSKGFIRLVQKTFGTWEGTVHERWHITKGIVEHLRNPVHHFPHQTLSEFLAEVNRYSSVRAKELYDQKISVSVFQIWFYPLAKFIVSYFLLLGFLNGPQGFVYSFMMSFHSFLVRAKLYQYYNLKKPAA